MNIKIIDRESRQVRDIDKGMYMYQGDLDGFRASWSADSRWLAWSRLSCSGAPSSFETV